MRKVLLVVSLIAASFAGGAVVNGPGLQWLKGIVRDRMTRDDAIPTLDVDDGSTITETETETSTVAEAPVVSDPPPPVDPPKPEPKPEPKVVPAPAEPLPQKDLSVDPKAPEPAAEPSPLPALPEPPPHAPRPPNDQGSTKSGWEDAPGAGPTTAVVPGRKSHNQIADSAVSAAAAPAPTPAPAEPPPLASSSPEPSAMPVPPSGPAPGEWAALRKRMTALGVSEYEVKGTPGGPVQFKCLVPGTGQEPVRPFEAEGDDEFQAADSALRRVAVWRAARRVKN